MTPLQAMLIRHEGLELRLYNDSLGIPTIGIGRNARDVGLSNDEALMLCDNDIATRRMQLTEAFPCFATLDSVRQDALIDMAFSGIGTISEFVKMWNALEDQDYPRAAAELMASTYAQQTGSRARDLANMIRTGAYPVA